jgi:predicted RNase H-like nuclease (RuvC/YqgF family)
MFNKQLRHNIKALDAQIGELSNELEGLKKDTKYDVKIRTLGDLIDFRSKLVKNKEDEKSDIIVELDKQIEELTKMIIHLESDEDYTSKIKKLEELTVIRCQLSEAKVKESNAPAVISGTLTGVIGLTAILMVIKHEKTDIITSKAFSIATRMFRGN